MRILVEVIDCLAAVVQGFSDDQLVSGTRVVLLQPSSNEVGNHRGQVGVASDLFLDFGGEKFADESDV